VFHEGQEVLYLQCNGKKSFDDVVKMVNDCLRKWGSSKRMKYSDFYDLSSDYISKMRPKYVRKTRQTIQIVKLYHEYEVPRWSMWYPEINNKKTLKN
jgi:hypothetical protein